MSSTEIVAIVVSLSAALVSVYNAIVTSRNIAKQNELAKEKLKDEHKSTDVSNTEKLQDMYQQAFGDFENLWKQRLSDQEVKHKTELEELRTKLGETYKQKEEILAFRIADLKGQVERMHGIVEGATGQHIERYMKRTSDHYPPDPIPPTENKEPK